MRKLFLLGLMTFIIVACAALSISWFSRSSEVKEDIKKYLASMKSYGVEVTYDSIATSGFPFSMKVSIINPHFVGDINTILKRYILVGGLNVDTIPKWQEDYTVNGSVDLTVNALSDRFTLAVNGSLLGKGKIGDKEVSIGTQYTSSSCELNVKRSSGLFGNIWDFRILDENKENILRDFRSLDCTASEGKMINNDTKEILLSYGGMRLRVGNAPKDDNTSAHFYVQVKDLEATKAYDSISEIYMRALVSDNTLPLPMLSLYGKQNFEIDLAYSGTTNWENPDIKNIPLDIKINKLLVSNAAYQSDASLSLTSNVVNGSRKSSFSFKTVSTATDLLDGLLKEQWHSIMEDLANTGAFPEMKAKLASMSAEEKDKLISSVIPDFVALGEMVSSVDVNVTADQDFANMQADFSNFELSASPYGITANGSIKRDNTSPFPYGDVHALCNNCLNMIDDIMSYYDRVVAAISRFSANTATIPLHMDQVQAFKDFLVAIQVPSEDKSVIKIDVINGEKGPTINGKTLVDVMKIYGEILERIRKQKQVE